jgi:hypothetical protein
VAFTSGPVPVGGTATVTASIDWSQVIASEGARIRFGADCGSGLVFDTPSAGAGVETINVTAPGTPDRFRIFYTGAGDALPSDDNSAGSGFKFEIAMGTEQGVVTDDPLDANPTDHKYYQLDDQPGQSTLWRLIRNDGSHLPVNATTGATVVGRLKTTSFTAGATIPQNLLIYHDTIAAGAHWSGAGTVREPFRGNTAPVITDDQYHIVRVTSLNVPEVGNFINIYVDENPVPVMSLLGAPDASSDLGSSPELAGVGFGTQSNSAVQTILYDWVSGTNAGAFAPGEEVACIGSLIPANICSPPPFADTDKDGDVDMDDFGVFQRCYTGRKEDGAPPIPLNPAYCACLDRGDDDFDTQPDSDGDIDPVDLNAFTNCFTGASIPWSQALKPNCIP